MPFPLIPIALLGSAAIGGIASLLASNKAASTATQTAQRSEAFERDIINRQLAQTAPYADTGYGALTDLATAYGQSAPARFDPYAELGDERFISPTSTGGMSGNALADFFMTQRNRISTADRPKFDAFIAQIRAQGGGTTGGTPGAGMPGQTGTLEQRRADYMQRFQDSPLYKLTYEPAMKEARTGIERNASAMGQLNSGRTLKALQDRGADIANRTYGAYEGGLWNMAGFGPQPTPAGGGVSSAINSGAQAGYAQAAGILGAGNAVSNALGSYAYLNGLRSSSAYGGG